MALLLSVKDLGFMQGSGFCDADSTLARRPELQYVGRVTVVV